MSDFNYNIGYTDLGGAMAGIYGEARLISKGKKFATLERPNGLNKTERFRVKVEHLVSLDYARRMTAHNRPEYARPEYARAGTTNKRLWRKRGCKTMSIFTGIEAIEYAENNGLGLNKYGDPLEGARNDLTPDEAREVAAEDPSLIWIEAE